MGKCSTKSLCLIGCFIVQLLLTACNEDKSAVNTDVQGQSDSSAGATQAQLSQTTTNAVPNSAGSGRAGSKYNNRLTDTPYSSGTYPITLFYVSNAPVYVLHYPWMKTYGSGSDGFNHRMTWTMINVCPGQGQADCHLLEFPNGAHVLIDAGEGWDAQGAALSYLKKAGIKRLQLVVLSHVHWDHYGKLIDIINSGIQVDRVALSLPVSREVADAEIPWGADWDDVQALLRFLAKHNIPYWTPVFGERLVNIKMGSIQTLLEVVCHYDGINTPVGRTDVNDTSMIVRLTHGSTRALFTGDLNTPLGAWLATSSFDLQADILKVPHHGTDGLAPNSFFDKVAPKVALVPSPKDLWLSDRSKRARKYFSSHNVPTYVSGIDGTVKITMTGSSYEITTESKR